MAKDSVPKHEALLTTLQRVLELSTTTVSETLHGSAQLVAQALTPKKWTRFSTIQPQTVLIGEKHPPQMFGERLPSFSSCIFRSMLKYGYSSYDGKMHNVSNRGEWSIHTQVVDYTSLLA
jgi:hypothetical protein